MQIEVRAVAEDEPGSAWRALFERHAEAYLRWYGGPGSGVRPTYLECEHALRKYLPEWFPHWQRLCEIVGGGDLEARFLSLYRPPPYVQGCSQAVLTRPAPLLVRNYDYAPILWDGTVLRTRWGRHRVLALTDCLVGVLDGVNDAGLAISLSFGGSQETGDGFGAPLLLRVALETCETAGQAAQLVRRVPTHMAYNIVMLDRTGEYFTAFTAPGRPTIIRRTAVSTNHQDRIRWARHAYVTATLERERALHALVADPRLEPERLVDAFLRPPLRSTGYSRGFGTLYTAVYQPGEGALDLVWPGERWTQTIESFEEGVRTISFPDADPAPPGGAGSALLW